MCTLTCLVLLTSSLFGQSFTEEICKQHEACDTITDVLIVIDGFPVLPSDAVVIDSIIEHRMNQLVGFTWLRHEYTYGCRMGSHQNVLLINFATQQSRRFLRKTLRKIRKKYTQSNPDYPELYVDNELLTEEEAIHFLENTQANSLKDIQMLGEEDGQAQVIKIFLR